MRPPAPAGALAQTSYSLTGHRPGAVLPQFTPTLRYLSRREHAAKSSAKAGDNGRSDALAQACCGCRLAPATLVLLVTPT